MVISLVQDLFIILTAGLILGVIAKRLGFSMLVGYLLAGALIGRGGIGLVAGNTAEIEHIAEVGVLLLLFSIGIEFSLEELLRLSRHFFVGGSIQMLLVAAPVAAICSLMYVPWPTALLIASATALSSTVLVFRALSEWGETASPQGRRAIGILLFQDAALVPLMLLMPLLAGEQEGPLSVAYLLLGLNSVLFVAGVLVLRRVFARWLVPMLGNLRSVELVILFGLIVLVGFCLTAVAAGLPPALGALAAGLALSGNRLTGQIDALILPYRESFGVVFFVSLGTLLDPSVLMEGPLLLILGFVVVLLIKTAAASVALLAAGLPWRAAAGMGMGLAQMGELTFVLISVGLHAGLISENEYNRMLFVAIGTLFVTPQLLKVGLQYSRHAALAALHETDTRRDQLPSAPQAAIVIGIGPIGRQAASQLEIMGVDVCLV
ncbi:MAG: cation:proton antiporter, partial [Planctomycetota bacterium]|nr:cation:proton antiporter [Planctomycetota bacterium]